jgi:hypothetical protein
VFRSCMTCTFAVEHTAHPVMAGSQEVRGSDPVVDDATC